MYDSHKSSKYTGQLRFTRTLKVGNAAKHLSIRHLLEQPSSLFDVYRKKKHCTAKIPEFVNLISENISNSCIQQSVSNRRAFSDSSANVEVTRYFGENRDPGLTKDMGFALYFTADQIVSAFKLDSPNVWYRENNSRALPAGSARKTTTEGRWRWGRGGGRGGLF